MTLDRLLELEFEKWKAHAHLRLSFTESEELEYQSLKKEIQENLEKAEKHDKCFCKNKMFITNGPIKIEYPDLEQENKQLKEKLDKLEPSVDSKIFKLISEN